MKLRILFALAAILCCLSLSACNTISGVGKDITGLGKAMGAK